MLSHETSETPETLPPKPTQKASKQLKITPFIPQIGLKMPLLGLKNTSKTLFFAQKIAKTIVF
jgi:hypothetical protein